MSEIDFKELTERLDEFCQRTEKRLRHEQADLELKRHVLFRLKHVRTDVDRRLHPGKNGAIFFHVAAHMLGGKRWFFASDGIDRCLPEVLSCEPDGPDAARPTEMRCCESCRQPVIVLGVHSDEKNFSSGDHYDELNLYSLCPNCLRVENFARAERPSARGLFLGNH